MASGHISDAPTAGTPISANISVLARWNEGMDTASISEATRLPEALVANIIGRHRDSHIREMQRRQGQARTASEQNQIDFDTRDRVIVQLRQDGRSQTEIAKAFDISPGRVSQILKAHNVPSFRATNPIKDFSEARIVRIVELYNAGLSLAELAERECVTVPALSVLLSGRPDYMARHGGGINADPSKLSVPEWVPAGLIARYVRLALRSGEATAARCIRNAKRMGLPR